MIKETELKILSEFKIPGIIGLIVAILLTVVFQLAIAMPTLDNEHLLNIVLKDQNFSNALEAVGKQLGIKIVFHGQEPIPKKDLYFSNVPLNRALSRIMRLYGVDNSATIHSSQKNILTRIDIYGYSTTGHVFQSLKQKVVADDREMPLNQFQLDILLAQNDIIVAEMEEGKRPLSSDQIDLLQKNSARIEAERMEDMKPLSPDQLEQLKERSREIENEIENAEKNNKRLSTFQLEKLRQKSNMLEIEELENNEPPLSPDQILLLQEKYGEDGGG